MQIINQKIVHTDGWSIILKNKSRLLSNPLLLKASLFLYLMSFLCITTYIDANNCAVFQESFSSEEQGDLKRFFHYIFAENELAYPLFGDKPMSFCFLPTSTVSISTRDHVFKIITKGALPLLPGLKGWHKFKQFRRNKNFILFVHEKNGFPETVFSINRRSFFDVFNKNVDAELDFLDRHLQPIAKTSKLQVVTPVSFAVDPEWRESILLRYRYQLLHKELTCLFIRSDWLQIILEKL